MATFTVKAGASVNFDLPARYILIDSVTAGLSVVLRGRSDNLDLEYDVRGGGKLSGLPEIVTHWTLQNKNAIDVDVVLQGGQVFYDENRLDGDVNALVRSDNLTVDGNQFLIGYDDPANVGFRSQVGLWNPVGSAVDVIVGKLLVNGAASSFYLGYDVTKAGYNNFTPGFYPNKKINSPIGKAQIYSMVTGFDVMYYNNNIYPISQVPIDSGSSVTMFDFKAQPLIIPEGRMLLVISSVDNSRISASFEYSEVSNV